MEPTNQEIGAALRDLLDEMGVLQKELAARMGKRSESTGTKLVQGELPFTAKRLGEIALALGISRDRLDQELRRIIAKRPLSMRVSGSMQESTAPRGVPMMAPVAAGSSNHTAEIDAPRSTLPITTQSVGDENAFALEVVGDSMSPLLDEGDIVVCSPRAAWQDGDPCFVEMRDRSDTIKAVYRLGDGRVELRPLNPRRHRARIESDDQDTGRIARIVRVVGRYTPLNGRHR